jgi:MFS family permease
MGKGGKVSWFKRTHSPEGDTPGQVKRRNYRNVQIDGIGIGFANAATPFLPVFLTRLGATNVQVGLLTSMPALTGLLLSIFIGNFLQSKRNIVPWFSMSRLIVVSSYALTGLVPFFVPPEYTIPAILLIWAVVTIPQTVLAVSFSVVMNAVAGPEGRFELMSKRWSIVGVTTAVTVAAVGMILVRIDFPINYQLVFMGLSLGGLFSYFLTSRLQIEEAEPIPIEKGVSAKQRFQHFIELVRQEPAFLTFVLKRFVFLSGSALTVPLFPLYYVREVGASDAWIGIINMVQTAVLLMGYFFWTRSSRKRGSRFVLLWTTLGLSLYPAFAALTLRVEMLALYAGIAGIFQAGLDLVFFDELMKRVPVKYSATFVSIAQSLQFLSAVGAPLIGTYLATHIGIGGALLVSAGIRFAGFALFAGIRPVLRRHTWHEEEQ